MKHFPEFTGEDQEGVAGLPFDFRSLIYEKPRELPAS